MTLSVQLDPGEGIHGNRKERNLTGHIPSPDLPKGDYPFIDRLYPLAELAMIEVPIALRDLLIDQAAKSGLSIARDAPTELRCVTGQFGLRLS